MGATVIAFNLVVVGLSVTGGLLAARRVISGGTTEGVSLVSQVGLLFSCSSWSVFGVLNADLPQLAANGVGVAAIVPVLLVGHSCGRLRVLPTAACVAGFGTVLILGTATYGPAFAGGIASVLTVANKIPQLAESWRAPGGPAVSINGTLFGTAGASMWLIYGLIHGAALVVITSLYCALAGAFVAFRAAQSQREDTSSVCRLELSAA